jgi:phenylalanyl-tRNA synthetase beta chain
VRLFELGRRYASTNGSETDVIAGLAAGSRWAAQWGAESERLDFFDVKSDVEALLALTGATESFTFVPEKHPALHPGQSARILREAKPVGWIGALHPSHVAALDLTYPAIVFELEIVSGFSARVPEFSEISRYPAIQRDIAVIVDEAVPVDALKKVVRSGAGALLKDLRVLSVYRGRQFENDKKSIALGLQLQDTSRTLTDNEADSVVAQVIEELRRELHATIRDK